MSFCKLKIAGYDSSWCATVGKTKVFIWINNCLHVIRPNFMLKNTGSHITSSLLVVTDNSSKKEDAAKSGDVDEGVVMSGPGDEPGKSDHQSTGKLVFFIFAILILFTRLFSLVMNVQ